MTIETFKTTANNPTPKFDRLVQSLHIGAPLTSRVEVSGMNLAAQVHDDLNQVLVISGPTQHLSTTLAKNLGYDVALLSSFFFPDTCAGITIKDYNSDIFRVINAPNDYTKADWPYQVKMSSQHLTYYEVCRILNHMAAWDYSIRTNKSVIILEHDALLTRKHERVYPRFNAINMLADTYFHSHNTNWVVGAGVHAYAIDCRAAKKLFNKVMNEGLINPLELMFRIDEFNITLFNNACKVQVVDNVDSIFD